ncbi:GntR family transcriptional regulator, transcriptional repressor for pyruvate dehydrogenase complex [Micromonospora rhizosphaerae]|uniref:GntR family transcriptional regulator, transcriptional repressor for pyruvate dehydrogenase complex n=1 Tax=Micromonospora rhizosphaerae TaxID=568872 RepID=A0A1C6T428_9ACTN|nr:FCD domain-containing protein [Micromonospora rhizosphaerae]SCL36447.1 GntR family transcriptional regulator, transcriptional repressor for pyruvate dehydrogenase complex [Micromonospora rhizosphaerae]
MSQQFQPIQGRGTVDAVVQRLGRVIRQGTFKPGQKLPPERVLAEQLEVSRQTIRKAIRELEKARVVRIVSDGGPAKGATVVTSYVPAYLLDGPAPEPNVSEVANVLAARRLFETPVAVLAGHLMTHEDHERIREVLDLQRTAKDLEGVRQLDLRFHLAIAEATHNPTIVSLMHDLLERLEIARHVLAYDPDAEMRESIAMHEQTLDAIASRDEQRIRKVMDAHMAMMEHAWERVTGYTLPLPPTTPRRNVEE